jgi:hypothetical protein
MLNYGVFIQIWLGRENLEASTSATMVQHTHPIETELLIFNTASLMILATTEAGKLRSSGLSAMHPSL